MDSSDDKTTRRFSDREIRDTVIFSAQLLTGEEMQRTRELIPQYGLLGSIVRSKERDTRVFLNTNNPASFFICGLQGSGKSHSLSTILGE